jgi:signal transduction histidine kinase/CheY-like chemotaxis protein
MSLNSSIVEQKLRQTGFKVLIVFAILIWGIILMASPNNVFIAWFISFSWFSLACYALLKPAYSKTCAKVWVIISVPVIPILVLANGIVPATLISIATLFPVILVKDYWRVFSVVIIASSTLLVPFSDVPYDNAIWLRLSISNAIVAIMMLALVTYLEQALLDSLNKSDELKRALDREREARRTQSTFLASMSLEIRTPMNGISGLLDVILLEELPEKQRSNLERIKFSGDMLHRILNDILDFSKLSAGKLLIESIPIDISKLVVSACSVFQSKAQGKGIDLNSAIDSELQSCLFGDPTRITQVITNLVDNAIKFTDKGKIQVSVNVVEQTATEQTVEFCVSDTGIGIPISSQKDIFSAFTQADSSTARRYGGTGLGLQIAKSLVEQMGGKMWLVSNENVGSQFYFILTLKISDGNLMTSKADFAKEMIERQSSPYFGEVLVVEDNEINQVVAQQILSSYGLTVDLADDGEQCIEALKHKEYDLIFMDLHMPNMDGFEACKIIRQSHPQLPIVALTAAVLKDELEKATTLGMNGHLAKPIDHVQLKNILNLYLNKQI